MSTPTPRYRLSHHPQVPFQPFEVEHPDLAVVVAVRDALADYDHFMLKYRHRRDFTNASYIEEQDLDSDDWWELDDYDIECRLDAAAAAARDLAEAETYEEEDYRLAPLEEVDGRYVVRRYTRRVTPWQPETMTANTEKEK